MKIYFSPKITLICIALALAMGRASLWQWERHDQKQEYIAKLSERVQLPPAPLLSLIPSLEKGAEEIIHRRVEVSGKFDFSKEMILRNRRLDGTPGVFSIVPLRIEGSEHTVLVSRGFLPFAVAGPEPRKKFQSPTEVTFTGLVKESGGKMSQLKKILAPADSPSGPEHPWVDSWLRIDIEKMQAQLPYKILPVYLELMNEESIANIKEQVVSTEAGREEMLVLPSGKPVVSTGAVEKGVSYPIPTYTTVIPPGRHFGYIFEWAFMALGTLLLGLLLQLRPPRRFKDRITNKKSGAPSVEAPL